MDQPEPARVTLNRGMLRLQSSMASQINGGQLNELVNTAKTCWPMPSLITTNTMLCQIPGLDPNGESPWKSSTAITPRR